jgi:hypothetical protein
MSLCHGQVHKDYRRLFRQLSQSVETRIARFILVQRTKTGKNKPNGDKIKKWLQSRLNSRRKDQMAVE